MIDDNTSFTFHPIGQTLGFQSLPGFSHRQIHYGRHLDLRLCHLFFTGYRRRNRQITQAVFHHALKCRRGNNPAVIGTLWFVHHHQDGQLRVIHRSEAYKGRHMFIGYIATVHSFLGRACFPGQPVAGNLGTAAGSVRHHRFQQPAELIGGVGGYYLPHHLGSKRLHNGTVDSPYFPHNLGFHQQTAVGHRPHHGNHLQRSHRNALTERNVGLFHRPHTFYRHQNTFFFPGKSAAWSGAEAKVGYVAVERLPGHPHTHGHKAYVTGVFHHFGKSLAAVGRDTSNVMAGHLHTASAVKPVAFLDCFFFQGRSSGNNLEGRSGFIVVPHG